MKRRALLGLAGTSIGVGALYGTGAFSSVSAGRGVSVNAAEDPENALLGIDITYENEEFGTANQGIPDTVEVTDLINNLSENINSINAEVTSIIEEDDNDKLVVANELELKDGISSEDDPVAIELGCGGDEAEGVSDVVITIINAEANSVTISDKPILIENVNYNCGESDEETEDGDIEFTELTATVETQTQGGEQSIDAVSFDYELTEDAQVVFTVSIGDREWTETTEPEDRNITVDTRPRPRSSRTVEVEADIDGGGGCFATIEERDVPVEVCD